MYIKIHFIKLWKFIYEQGIGTGHSLEDQIILLLNKAASLTALGAIAMSTYCYFFFKINLYTYIPLTLFFLYASIILFHRFNKIHLARLYITFILPIWIYISILLVGGFFSQGVAIVTTIILGYFFFQKNKKLQRFVVIFHSIIYVLVTSYATFWPPVFQIEDIPFDEACVFLISLSWIYIIFSVFEKEKEDLIYTLRMKNKDLEKTTAELERFTHIASHDLKSPLRTIISFLGLMERDMKRNNLDGLSENLAFAKSGANQLNYLIKDVLELSKINAKTYKERQEFDLSLTLKKVMFNIESELKEKNVRIHMGELPVYLCNEVEFVLLFQNFIQNGIKYNNSVQPKIKIWSEQKDDCICIYFKDNGIGIEEKYFSHIFEYFKRLHTTNEYSGSGLGLAMSKKIVESYQGEIELNSKIGEGSTFIIKLPLEKPKINSNSSLAQAN